MISVKNKVKVYELHTIKNMMEGHYEIAGQKLPDFLIDFFNAIEKDLEVLQQYKKLEEKLGIDLITLFKAMNGHFYIKKFVTLEDYQNEEVDQKNLEYWNSINSEIIGEINPKYLHLDLWYKTICFERGMHGFEVFLADCGKTWALTKEELEK